MQSHPVSLEPSSLYICLTRLISPGFHWSLYFTGTHGRAIRREWAEVKNRSGRGAPVESYQEPFVAMPQVINSTSATDVFYALISRGKLGAGRVFPDISESSNALEGSRVSDMEERVSPGRNAEQ
jgi:hypothetical protein